MTVELFDKERLREFLERDRALSVYLIGDLDERYFGRCRWWVDGADAASVSAVTLLYAHPAYPTVLTLGSVEGIRGIVSNASGGWPDAFHAHLWEDHVPLFEERYEISSRNTYLRMIQRKEDAIRFWDGERDASVKRLNASDLGQVHEVLQDYPEAFFSDEDLDSGYYFGIYDGAVLATMAGVHVISPESKVAVGGNVVTRVSHRRRGYSTRCTAELLRRLYREVDVVALNVLKDNLPAIREYEGLGFTRYSELVMGYCRRKSVSS